MQKITKKKATFNRKAEEKKQQQTNKVKRFAVTVVMHQICSEWTIAQFDSMASRKLFSIIFNEFVNLLFRNDSDVYFSRAFNVYIDRFSESQLRLPLALLSFILRFQ